jgi:hypothetical protein
MYVVEGVIGGLRVGEMGNGGLMGRWGDGHNCVPLVAQKQGRTLGGGEGVHGPCLPHYKGGQAEE